MSRPWEFGPTGNTGMNDGYLPGSPDLLYSEDTGVLHHLGRGQQIPINRLKRLPQTKVRLRPIKPTGGFADRAKLERESRALDIKERFAAQRDALNARKKALRDRGVK